MRVDAQGVFLAWGNGLTDVFGWTEADVIGQRVDMLVPRALRKKHWEGFNKAVERGHLRRPGKVFRSVGVHKRGGFVPFRSVDLLDFGDDGAVVGVTAIILDRGWRSLAARVPVPEAARAATPDR
jgi:PAS domain S-box-containing protein